MVLTMQSETTNIDAKFSLTNLSTEQLIDLCISLTDSASEIRIKDELVNRGKNNIQQRIVIKKQLKKFISTNEGQLKDSEIEKNGNKEILKKQKNEFLTLVSIQDKLQIEWQKYDLGLKK